MEVSAHQLCDPPELQGSVVEKKSCGHGKRKLGGRHTAQVDLTQHAQVGKENEERKVLQKSFHDVNPVKIPLMFCNRHSDGFKLQIGDIVKAENFSGPLIVSEMWQDNSIIHTKLKLFNVSLNCVVNNFSVQCEINFLSPWDGEKVKAKSTADGLVTAATNQLASFLQTMIVQMFDYHGAKSSVCNASKIKENHVTKLKFARIC